MKPRISRENARGTEKTEMNSLKGIKIPMAKNSILKRL